MFESLSDRLQGTFKKLRSKGRLSEEDVTLALREVRVAFLEADVSLPVVRDFIERVRARAQDSEVRESLTPAQHVVKIVNEELIKTLGDDFTRLQPAPHPPTVIMLVGLQGSGKTTHAAKLALVLRKQGMRPLLVAADTYRPAAVQQIVTLGRQLNIPVHEEGTRVNPVEISAHAVEYARRMGFTAVILDTAGRLQLNEEMMAEVAAIRERVQPHEVLLVADAMTGREAVKVAQEFHTKVGLTGLILTKMDGDARGGAALSIRSVTGVPIKYLGTGEKLDAIEPFHPERLASRILGMGDILSLVEKAQETFDQEQALAMQKKLRAGSFNLEDFLSQVQQVKRMGPLQQLLEMIPGLASLVRQREFADAMDDRQLKRIEAIIYSMTPRERRNPDIIDGSRRRRIARGSGTTAAEVNQLINQFREMQKVMKHMASGKVPKNLTGMLR